MKTQRKKTPLRKLSLHRETLRRVTNTELDGVAGGAPTKNGPACNTFSEPSLCPTCLCT